MTRITVATPKCQVCGESTIVELDKERFDRWQAGEYIQDVWPAMPKEKREMLISGTHPWCWEQLFGEEED